MKELFMDEHDALIEAYMENHPDADFSQAVDATADRAYQRTIDRIADMADAVKDRMKEQGTWRKPDAR